MFDYLFKRLGRVPAASVPVPAPTSTSATLAERKQAALSQAQALAGDEVAAVEFILQCEFPDARVLAAQFVQSEPLLQRLLAPMRRTDRRVARLLQQRLEALAQQQRAARQAQAWLDSAQQLLDEPRLLPNQVAELDRAWEAIGAVAPMQQGQYQALRAGLEARLLAQAALQRAALDTLARWRQLQETLATAAVLPPAAEITRALAILENAMTNHLTAPEAASLPRHFQNDFEQQRAAFRASWLHAQEREQALAARRQALAEWQAAAPQALLAAELQRAWQALPALASEWGEAADLERQFQALLGQLAASRINNMPRASRPDQGQAQRQAQQQAREALLALEAALQEGTLQGALDADAGLRALDLPASAWPPAQAARLGAARAELARLQGWARWGGNLSRAELLNSAQELPAKALPAPELARQVGALRDRWKGLDSSAGAAPRELWQQFDAACNAAYAPAAEYFSRQAEQRRENLAQAEALLAQSRQYATELARAAAESDAAHSIDWKEAALFCTRLQQARRRLGDLERKHQKRLQREFDAALQALAQPLAQQQADEALRREELIAAALALNPATRDTPEAVRALQQRWQERAQALPLEHKQEQQLWQRFRAACDAVFAQRKQASASANQERRRNLQQKETWCQALEGALGAAPARMRQLITESQAAWGQIGAVPRAHEQQINQRRAAALAALQAQLARARQGALEAGFAALEGKLALCQEWEQRLAGSQPWLVVERDEAQARWQALAPLAAPFEQALRARFDAVTAALEGADHAYAALLEKNRTLLLASILQLEILCAVDSPPALARQRLQVQVEVLAAKLKNGDAALAAQAQLLTLCGLPACCDQESAARIGRLLAKCAEMRLTGVVLADGGAD